MENEADPRGTPLLGVAAEYARKKKTVNLTKSFKNSNLHYWYYFTPVLGD
jgi:hypothetical protein